MDKVDELIDSYLLTQYSIIFKIDNMLFLFDIYGLYIYTFNKVFKIDSRVMMADKPNPTNARHLYHEIEYSIVSHYIDTLYDNCDQFTLNSEWYQHNNMWNMFKK